MFTIFIPKENVKRINKLVRMIKNINVETIFNDKDRDQLALRINTTLQENINNRLDVDRRPMKELSPKTYNRKRPPRGGPSAIPLKDTGFLYGGMEYEVKNGVIILRNNTPYVLFHQDGTDDIPQRKIYPDQKDLPDYLQKIIDDFLNKRIAKNLEDFIK